MSGFDPIDYFHYLKALQRSVDAIACLALLIPEDDNISPLICALSNSLEGALNPVMSGGIKLSGAGVDALCSSQEPLTRSKL